MNSKLIQVAFGVLLFSSTVAAGGNSAASSYLAAILNGEFGYNVKVSETGPKVFGLEFLTNQSKQGADWKLDNNEGFYCILKVTPEDLKANVEPNPAVDFVHVQWNETYNKPSELLPGITYTEYNATLSSAYYVKNINAALQKLKTQLWADSKAVTNCFKDKTQLVASVDVEIEDAKWIETQRGPHHIAYFLQIVISITPANVK